MAKIAQGTWVEIEQVVLTPEQRVQTLPQETRSVPYLLRVSGFLLQDAEIGQDAQVKTIIGRTLSGKLKTVNPGYSHSFGETIAELLPIGTDQEEI
jgi:hypothetical protein